MNSKIAIYNGMGSSLRGFSNLNALLLTEESILKTDWEKTCSHLIIPGGRDRPYHAVLQGAGNQKIRKFVEEGGTYIGLCAGAYFACASIEFEKGSPLEICEERELSFFPGKAVGPAYGNGFFAYESERGAKAALLETEEHTFYAYYNGGCTFEGDFSRCKILARYGDIPGKPPAIIECKIGQGRAILSGAHIEISPSIMSEENFFHEPMIPLLISKDFERERFFLRCLGHRT